MDVITFEIGDITIQLVHGDALFWANGTDHEPDITLPIDKLRNMINTANMLRKHEGIVK